MTKLQTTAAVLTLTLLLVCCSSDAARGIGYKTAAQRTCLISRLQEARVPFKDDNDGVLWYPREHAETVKRIVDAACLTTSSVTTTGTKPNVR